VDSRADTARLARVKLGRLAVRIERHPDSTYRKHWATRFKAAPTRQARAAHPLPKPQRVGCPGGFFRSELQAMIQRGKVNRAIANPTQRDAPPAGIK